MDGQVDPKRAAELIRYHLQNTGLAKSDREELSAFADQIDPPPVPPEWTDGDLAWVTEDSRPTSTPLLMRLRSIDKPGDYWQAVDLSTGFYVTSHTDAHTTKERARVLAPDETAVRLDQLAGFVQGQQFAVHPGMTIESRAYNEGILAAAACVRSYDPTAAPLAAVGVPADQERNEQ